MCRITGEDCFVMKVAVRSMGHLEEFLNRLVPYGRSVTSIILSTPVTHRTLTAADDKASVVPGSRL